MANQHGVFFTRGDQLLRSTSRRSFLQVMGLGGVIVLMPTVFAACGDDGVSITDPTDEPYTLDLSTDVGILNYAYALEQLEAAYYTVALSSAGYAALSANEKEVLSDLQKHEVIHREFLKQVLGPAAIPTIDFNTTTVGTLTANRNVLLSTSQLLEDTGVSAYNGAGKYLTTAANLLVAGKIVSVEARHAAAIRDIRDGTNGRLFAGDDVVNAAGLDTKAEPDTVLASVASLNVVVSPLAIGTSPNESRRTPDQTAPAPT